MGRRSGPRTDQLDASGGPRGQRQAAVTGQEHSVQGPRPGPRTSHRRPSGSREVPQTRSRRGSCACRRRSSARRSSRAATAAAASRSPSRTYPSQRLSHLDVDEMGRVQRDRGIGDARRDRPARCRIEQELQDGGSIEDDQRPSLSALMTSDGRPLQAPRGASGQPLEHLVARRMIEGFPDLAQDVVRHRHALGGGPDLQAAVEFRGGRSGSGPSSWT